MERLCAMRNMPLKTKELLGPEKKGSDVWPQLALVPSPADKREMERCYASNFLAN